MLVFLLGAAGRASARGVGGSHGAPRTDAVQAGQGLVGGPQSSHGWTLGRQWGRFRSREEGTFQGRDGEAGAGRWSQHLWAQVQRKAQDEDLVEHGAQNLYPSSERPRWRRESRRGGLRAWDAGGLGQ